MNYVAFFISVFAARDLNTVQIMNTDLFFVDLDPIRIMIVLIQTGFKSD